MMHPQNITRSKYPTLKKFPLELSLLEITRTQNVPIKIICYSK